MLTKDCGNYKGMPLPCTAVHGNIEYLAKQTYSVHTGDCGRISSRLRERKIYLGPNLYSITNNGGGKATNLIKTPIRGLQTTIRRLDYKRIPTVCNTKIPNPGEIGKN